MPPLTITVLGYPSFPRIPLHLGTETYLQLRPQAFQVRMHVTVRDDRMKWPVSCQKWTLNQVMHLLCLLQVSYSF